LLEALQLASYDAVQGARLIHMGALLELAWVERQLGMEGWQERAASVEKVIVDLRAQGGTYINWGGTTVSYDAARLAAIRDDRDTALRELRITEANRWLSPWFLQHDALFAAWREDPEFLALVAAAEEHAAAERAKLAGAEIWP